MTPPNATLPASELLLALLALGCAAPGAGAAQDEETADSTPRAEEPVAPAPGELAPIRFGDPEELSYDTPFFPDAGYDESLPTPSELLGQEHGSRLAHHAEILDAFRAWADASPRITLSTYGWTHEGRELVYAVITSPDNHDRLDAIRDDLGKLFDPRELSEAEAERIVAESPAVAWMGYSIHGDELSGADAAMAVGHHLVASTDADVAELLERVVVVMDPAMNPDGRERIVSMVEQAAGHTPNLDYASMHRGRWPYGRGNHYLFDMNRDWMAGTQPETRGRWRVARSFFPQLFVDAHEMGSLDTYLFYPQARPLNPQLPPTLVEWQRHYAEDAARAFDAHGWSFYTREWADAWAPFYSDAWGSLRSATGILYEQAGTAGSTLRRRSGELITYRETVHHQVVASMANLETLAARREEALRNYLATQRRNVAADTPGNDRAFVFVPGGNADREAELLRILAGQGIEVHRATEDFEATDVEGYLGTREETRSFPAGSFVVSARQPLRPMVRAYFDFDPRMPKEDLLLERQDLERKGTSRIYDLTAWSLPHAYDVESYWCDQPDVERELVDLPQPPETSLAGAEPAVGWAVSSGDDAVLGFAARALELRLAVHASDEPFTVAPEVNLPAGSLLVRAIENEGDATAVEAKVMEAARGAGVRTVHRLGTGLATDEGPDLGGQHFHLLARPRVALLANSPVASDTYGHLWFHLDAVLGVPYTLIDAQALGSADLRRYNVLVIPPSGGSLSSILEARQDDLASWVENGGTLIACGSSAAALTSGRLGLSSVTLRRHALEDLSPYHLAAERDRAALEVEIDEAEVWGDEPPQEEESAETADEASEEESDETEAEEELDPYDPVEVAEAEDDWLRLFSPRGVTLRGLVNPDAWITRGAGPEMPVHYGGSSVFLAQPPVRTAVRLAEEGRLRLGGLVWPEARERIAESAWLTVESRGAGQIVLFASVPAFRGYHRATGRLFGNAVILGPGLGASQPIGW